MPVNKHGLKVEIGQLDRDRLVIAERVIDAALKADFDPMSGRPVTVDLAKLAQEMGLNGVSELPSRLLHQIKATYEGQEWLVNIHTDQRDQFMSFI